MPKQRLSKGQLTWKQLGKTEMPICSCGGESFYYIRKVSFTMEDGHPTTTEKEVKVNVVCSECGAKYLMEIFREEDNFSNR